MSESRALGWDACDELLSEVGGGGDIIRLISHDDWIKGVFLDVPLGRKMVWTGNRYVEAGDNVEGKLKARFMMNVYVTKAVIEGKSLEVDEVRSIEMSKKAFQKGFLGSRKEYAEDNGGMDKCVFKMKRDGAKNNQETTYSFFFMGAVDEKLQAEIDASELIDLPKLADQLSGDAPILVGGPQTAGRIAGPSSQRGRIDDRTAGDITARLRKLGADVATEFKQSLQISTIREISEAQRTGALQILSKHEEKAGITVDPFK